MIILVLLRRYYFLIPFIRDTFYSNYLLGLIVIDILNLDVIDLDILRQNKKLISIIIPLFLSNMYISLRSSFSWTLLLTIIQFIFIIITYTLLAEAKNEFIQLGIVLTPLSLIALTEITYSSSTTLLIVLCFRDNISEDIRNISNIVVGFALSILLLSFGVMTFAFLRQYLRYFLLDFVAIISVLLTTMSGCLIGVYGSIKINEAKK